MKNINPYTDYQERLKKAIAQSQKIVIPEQEYEMIKQFSKEWEQDKPGVPHFKKDGNFLSGRSLHGHAGQVALEIFLNKRFTDLDPRFSFDKNVPDLSPIGLNFGVKTHRMKNPPLLNYISDEMYESMPIEIKKEYRYPQVILAMDAECDRTFYILGLFNVKVLYNHDYLDLERDLIYDPQLAAKGTKIPFIGVDQGVNFTSLEDLFKYSGKTWLYQESIVA